MVLSDESSNYSDVIRAIIDSGSGMCVVRRDIIDALDCLTVRTVTLRGIIGDPFDAEVKHVYIDDASTKQGMLPVACACHELVHDQLLLTPAVVRFLICTDPKQMDQDDNFGSGGNSDNCDNDEVQNDENDNNENRDTNVIGENLSAIRGHQNDETSHADECGTSVIEQVS